MTQGSPWVLTEAHEMAEKAVAYLRVSTKKQGENGLGIDAQRAAVAALARERGWELLGEHVEVESGARDDRPELAAALWRCRKVRARLVIARLDRLARDVEFIARLLKSDVEVTCCDLPGADRFVLHVMAAVAERERPVISERTRGAMQAAKARGRRFLRSLQSGFPWGLVITRGYRTSRDPFFRLSASAPHTTGALADAIRT